MEKVDGHVGANHLSAPAEKTHTPGAEVNVFDTILLIDVFEAVYATTRHQLDIVASEPLIVLVVFFSSNATITFYELPDIIIFQLKMDIEKYECRAIMGSQGIFSDPRFDIIAISTEWNYVLNGKISELCPHTQLKSFVQLLVQNSFEPTEFRSGKKLNPDESHTWPFGIHVFWKRF